MELPYSLQTLPPEAVDILRYYASISVDAAHADAIVDGAGLSERGFGKGILRLVTKNYLVMSSDQVYRLTDQGRRLIDEIQQYDSESPGLSVAEADDISDIRETQEARNARYIRRHLVLVAPMTLTPGNTAALRVGFAQADDDEQVQTPINVLLRLSAINGTVQGSREFSFALDNEPSQQSFEITAGRFTAVRARVEVCQFQDDDDFELCGGMFVDLPVRANEGDAALVAYGADVILREE